jgi:16S rRNA processing protein RimM
LKLLVYSRDPRDLERHRHFYIAGMQGITCEYQVEHCRVANQSAILKLQGVDDRNRAEDLRNQILLIREDQLPDTQAGEFFIKDLLGIQVVNQHGAIIGILTDVLELPAHDVYQIQCGQRELLIPAISDVVLEIRLAERIMVVRLPEGIEESE